jgi:hypothetical protein
MERRLSAAVTKGDNIFEQKPVNVPFENRLTMHKIRSGERLGSYAGGALGSVQHRFGGRYRDRSGLGKTLHHPRAQTLPAAAAVPRHPLRRSRLGLSLARLLAGRQKPQCLCRPISSRPA